MNKRFLAEGINQLILWPLMEIGILPVFILMISLSSFMLRHQPAELGWVLLLIGIPFGIVDGGALPPAFILRIWVYTFSLLGQTQYFLIMTPVMTYIYFQLAECMMMLIFKRSVGKMIFKQKIVTTNGEELTRSQAVRRGFYKWNRLLCAPIIGIIAIIKHENLFYDAATGEAYWDKKAGTKVVSCE